MVNIGNILSGAANAAGTAKDEATKTSRRKFITAVGGAALGTGVAEVATDGAVSETAGDWWEEIVEDPMGLDIETVNEYNGAVNDFEANFDEQYQTELHQARATKNVGRVPGHLEAGDTLDNEQYAALGFNGEDINNSDGNSLISRTLEDDNFTVLTPDAVGMGDVESFGDKFGALAINDDQNEYDASDLKEMRKAYNDAAKVTQDWMRRIDELQTEGSSLSRLSAEYEDEEELPAVEEARDHQEYLKKEEERLGNDHLRFRAQANLFDHALQNSPLSDGEEVGVDYEEETGTTTDTPTETPGDSYGEHDTYGNVSEYCNFEDDTINELHDWMDDHGVDSYNEIDVDIGSTNGDFTVEFSYEGDTISKDNVEGCGA